MIQKDQREAYPIGLPECEAKLCEGEKVALVGGGNSAGQAVLFLAPKVRRLHVVVRGPGLEALMSLYLINRIAALPRLRRKATRPPTSPQRCCSHFARPIDPAL